MLVLSLLNLRWKITGDLLVHQRVSLLPAAVMAHCLYSKFRKAIPSHTMLEFSNKMILLDIPFLNQFVLIVAMVRLTPLVYWNT